MHQKNKEFTVNKVWLKWKKRKLFSKITDVLFVMLVIALLSPTGRLVIGGFVNRIKSMIVQPGLVSSNEIVQLSENNYKWEFIDLDGKLFSLADFKGKVIFLNFWATWCPPCVGEMPSIQALYDRFKDNKKVAIILVTNDNPQKVKKFILDKGYSMPIYLSKMRTPEVLSSRSIPASFLISPAGKVVMKETGANNWGGDKMAGIIKKLIK